MSLARRGIFLDHGRDAEILQWIRVSEVIQTDIPLLNLDDTPQKRPPCSISPICMGRQCWMNTLHCAAC